MDEAELVDKEAPYEWMSAAFRLDDAVIVCDNGTSEKIPEPSTTIVFADGNMLTIRMAYRDVIARFDYLSEYREIERTRPSDARTPTVPR